MALPGFEPNPNAVNRNPKAEWSEVVDEPYRKGSRRSLPRRMHLVDSELVEQGWSEQTLTWWKTVRNMPHASLWSETDWLFASDTAVLKELFYTGVAKSGEMTEMRRREDLMGLSVEARRKLRIRYTRAKAVEPAAKTGTASVTSLPAWRDRLTEED